MIPIYVDPATVRILLIGRGSLAVRRLAWLREGGATPDVWSDAPSDELVAASANLSLGLPTGADIAHYQLIWVVDLPKAEAATLSGLAREAGVLVNVEDVPLLCDFHSPAVVRRGRLTLASGTGGASPAVSRAAREHLETAFPETWSEALEEIAAARAALRAEGAGYAALAADARTRLAQRGLI